MLNFSDFTVLNEGITFKEDDFTKFKNTVSVPDKYNPYVKKWLMMAKKSISDYFVNDAIDDLISALDKPRRFESAINFFNGKTAMSIAINSGQVSFYSDKSISFDTIKKMLGTK